LVSNASVFQGIHTVTALNNTATSQLANLNISGSGSVVVTGITTAATALTISNNATGTSATSDGITTLTSQGAILGALNFSGTKAFAIGTLTDDVANLTITNANTGTSGVLTIGSGAAHVQNTMVSLNLLGSVAYTGTSTVATAATVSGATNNSAVSMTFDITAGGIKTVTLGNGGNTVVTGTAKDVITVGTGANTITAGADADAITLGAGHTTSNTLILNAVVGTSTNSGQVVVAGAGNDTGADVYTNVNIATDVFSIVATTVTGFDGSTGAGTNVGIGTGGVGTTGTLTSFTTNTGVIYLGGTTNTFGTGDIAITFTTPTTALTTANFNSMLRYNLTGDGNANTIIGGSLADTIDGAVGADVITGGAGADIFGSYTTAKSTASVAANTTVTFDAVTDFTTTVDKFRVDSATTDFTAAATATVTTLVTQNNIADFAALKTAVDGIALVASTTTVAQAYIINLTGTGLAAAGVTRVLVVNNNDTALTAADLMIQLSGTSTTVVAGDFIFV